MLVPKNDDMDHQPVGKPRADSSLELTNSSLVRSAAWSHKQCSTLGEQAVMKHLVSDTLLCWGINMECSAIEKGT